MVLGLSATLPAAFQLISGINNNFDQGAISSANCDCCLVGHSQSQRKIENCSRDSLRVGAKPSPKRNHARVGPDFEVDDLVFKLA